MSAYSNRAIYNPTGGRALWGGADGRALYAGPAWLSHIYQSGYAFYGVDYVTGSNAWTLANYQQSQTDATNALANDNLYLWSCITRPAFMPFLFADPGSYTIDYDFRCEASFTNAKLLVATE